MAESATKTEKTLSITQVAQKLKLSYHRARNLMLKGEFGETSYEGRRLMVTEAGLVAYQEAQRKTKAKKPSPKAEKTS